MTDSSRMEASLRARSDGTPKEDGWNDDRTASTGSPRSPSTDYSEYAEAVLWARGEGVIGSETALVVWELAVVNPREIDVVARPATDPNGKVPSVIASSTSDWTWPTSTMRPECRRWFAVAIRQATEYGTPGDLIEQALTKAQARGLLDKRGAARCCSPSTHGPSDDQAAIQPDAPQPVARRVVTSS